MMSKTKSGLAASIAQGVSPWLIYTSRNALLDILRSGPRRLSPGERELRATYVSAENDCRYWQTIRGAIAAHHLGGNEALVGRVKFDYEGAEISPKLKSLLTIAGKV